MRGSTEYLSWLIALVLLAPIGIILALIYLFGVAPISHQLASASSYVSYVTTAIYSGQSYIAGGISPSLNENEFMMQIFVNKSCLYYLNLLGRNGILTNPTNPNALLGKFAICIGELNNNALGKEAWIISPSILPIDFGIPPWIVSKANYIGSKNVTFTISKNINYTLATINGSHGFMSLFYPYGYVNLSLAEEESAFACTQFFGNEVNGNPAAQYISQISCASLPVENNVSTFIAISTFCYPGFSCFAPMAFLHGSPAQFLLQVCKYEFNEFICNTELA